MRSETTWTTSVCLDWHGMVFGIRDSATVSVPVCNRSTVRHIEPKKNWIWKNPYEQYRIASPVCQGYCKVLKFLGSAWTPPFLPTKENAGMAQNKASGAFLSGQYTCIFIVSKTPKLKNTWIPRPVPSDILFEAAGHYFIRWFGRRIADSFLRTAAVPKIPAYSDHNTRRWITVQVLDPRPRTRKFGISSHENWNWTTLEEATSVAEMDAWGKREKTMNVPLIHHKICMKNPWNKHVESIVRDWYFTVKSIYISWIHHGVSAPYLDQFQFQLS